MVDAATETDDLVLDEPTSVVVLHDVGWELFEQILEARGERRMPRMAYLDGVLELMTTSREHEMRSRMLARLLFAYVEERGVELNAYGSFTMKKRRRKSGIEADECFNLVPVSESPDLAIEIEWSRARIDKLAIYHRSASAKSGDGTAIGSPFTPSGRAGTSRSRPASCSPISTSR